MLAPTLASSAAAATVVACPLVCVAVEDIDRAVVSSSVAPDASSATIAPALASKSRTRPSRRAARFSLTTRSAACSPASRLVVAMASLNTCTARAMPPISSLRAANGTSASSLRASRVITSESFEIGVSKWRTSSTDEAEANPRTTRIAAPVNKMPHSPLASSCSATACASRKAASRIPSSEAFALVADLRHSSTETS